MSRTILSAAFVLLVLGLLGAEASGQLRNIYGTRRSVSRTPGSVRFSGSRLPLIM